MSSFSLAMVSRDPTVYLFHLLTCLMRGARSASFKTYFQSFNTKLFFFVFQSNLKSVHQSAIDSHLKSEESLRDQISSLESKIQDASGQAADLELKLAESAKQLDSALSERLEMEAKLGSATDERTSLLERCLAAETELERSRNQIVELRRKMDDSQAALHELGRENQSIQVRKLQKNNAQALCNSCPKPRSNIWKTKLIMYFSICFR